jgi:gliding motility-associated-like protein
MIKQFRCSIFLFSIFLLGSLSLKAQLIVNNTVNATDGVQSVLLGDGVVATNITFAGNNDQIGSFDCIGCNLGLGSGLVMGSGNVNGAIGPNTSGSTNNTPASGFGFSDPDLAALSGFSLNDAAVLQFDFVPTGDSLAFNFVFGSDEYPEFANGSFNDAFAFFLSGPGITGPYSNNSTNIALIPNTTIPVTINNVNNGTSNTGPCEYCQYYVNNINSSSSPATAIQCDGFTTVLTAYAEVVCGQTYHIKLAIADAGDTSYDSFVFLEAGSFQSNQLQVSYTGATIAPGANSVYEGCDVGNISIVRPGNNAESISYNVTVQGTATNGVDYTSVPSTITFAPLQTEYVIPIQAIQDNMTEGLENVQVIIEALSTCSAAASSLEVNVDINDLPPLNVLSPQVSIDCNATATLAPQISGGIGYYSVVWDGMGSGLSMDVTPGVPTDYQFTVLDTCGVTPVTGVMSVVLNTYPPITINLGGDQTLTCLDNIVANGIVSGGYGAYSYAWSFNNASVGTNSPSIDFFEGTAGTLALQVTDECETQETESVAIAIPEVPISVYLGPNITATCLDVSDLEALPAGGVGTYSYQWSTPLGNLGSNSTLAFQTSISTTVTVTVEDECANVVSDNVQISIPAVPVSVDLGSDIQVTCLDVSTLEATVSGGVGTYNYQWTQQNGNLGTTSTIDFQTEESTTIALTVTDQCGNENEDFIEIQVPQVSVTVDLGEDLTVDCTDNIAIDASISGGVGSFSYNWEFNGQNAGFGAVYNLNTDSDAILSVQVTDQCGNSSADQLNIEVPQIPISVDIGEDLVVTCIDETVISSNVTGGIGVYSYAWSDGGGIVSVGEEVVYTAAQDVTMTLSVEDACGNSGQDQIQISVPPVPVELEISNDTTLCVGEAVTLMANASGGVGNFEYTWSDAGAYQNQLFVTPSMSTLYSVLVEDECNNTDEAQVLVNIEDVIPSFSMEYIGEFGIQLVDWSHNAASIEWNFNGESTSSESVVTHSFSSMDPWIVSLTVTGELGCVRTVSETYYPLSNIYVPGAFTPNGDGVNDVFEAKGHDLRKYEIRIFNRWGDVVFESNDINEVWLGQSKVGEYYVPDGVYNYQVKAEGIRGNFIDKEGTITIFR